ncbi:MAG: cytochrome ubiquinol oxidase subunit I [Terracidiphilus sp.]|nr:cytochrome ubiquinol oxidase subunit I [Terracidiphilus sp.]MDR3777270.1 cytochrome ubiquinol oxidase subunit I [Terracidiphilus sp.]
MNYPFWDIPHLGSGWVIGIIAIFHVMISQFAVGGGLYLPMAERKALNMPEGQLRTDWLKQLARHSKFFLVLTAVFGTVSGVGIWFAIGLTHPEATSTLIHNFVFGWAMEWVFFLVELTTIAVYYSTWDKIDPKLHLKVGWVYAVASVFTLIIINGILAFMLTPGDAWIAVAGTGQEASKFWNAFFNPTYWPSLFLRSCVCASLAGLWALITSSRIDGDKQPELKTSMIKWSVKWLVPSFVAMPFLMIWYYMMVPASQQALLSLGIDTINAGTFSAVTRMALVIICASATIIFVAYFLAYRNPLDFNLSHAMAVLLLALIATGAGEYSREMLRKPYVIGRWMYSNGVRVPYVARINQEGYLAHSNWVWNQSASSYSHGEAIFRGECGSCHTLGGYRPLQTLLAGRDRANIASFITMLHDYKADSPYRRFMPPMVGTKQDIDDLANYLNAHVNPPVPGAQKPVLKAEK